MGLTFILVLCIAGIVCLTPLAIYLFWLSFLTRRDQPSVISGVWDFATLLTGLSGFVLFGGALVLSLLQSNVRYWMRGNFEALRGAWGQEKVSWSILAGAYLLVILVWVALTLISRRRSLVVYNIDPAEFETTLGEAFEHIGRPVERRGNYWHHGGPLFVLDRFQWGRTVTLRWVSEDQRLFEEVDRLVRDAVPPLAPEKNPSSRWLMLSAWGVGCLAVACSSLILFAYAAVI